MTNEIGEREKIFVSEAFRNWFDIKREFSKQILSLSTLSTAGIYALGLKAEGSVDRWLIASGVFFVICITCSLMEMFLDAKVLKFTLKGDEVDRPLLTRSVKILSSFACLTLIAGVLCAGAYVLETKRGDQIMSDYKNRQGNYDGERDLSESKELLKDAQQKDSEASKSNKQKSS